MDGALHLVTVSSPSEEKALLHNLTRRDCPLASYVAPVRQTELSRFQRLARRCEREVIVQPFAGHEIDATDLHEGARDEFIPDLLVVGPMVERSLIDLAAMLCHREVILLEDLASARATLPQRITTAMLLWSPDSTPISTVIAGLEALTERQISIGLLPCFGSDADRWSILKALSLPLLPNRGRNCVMSASLHGANAPECVRSLNQDASNILHQQLDLLAFEGHGNPQDIFLGRNAILCSRQTAGTEATPSGSGFFPCYHDGICFRRAFRLPDAELVAGEELDALMLLALTCYYVHLGKSPFSHSAGIVHQIMKGNAIAAISSPGVVWTHPEILILGLSLIHEGKRLADVACALDRLQRDTLKLSSGLPATISSIFVFGNPCARLQPLGVTDLSITSPDGRTLVLQSPTATPRLGAFLRITLDDLNKSVSKWSLEGLADGAWAHGARSNGASEERLHIWLGEQALNGHDTLWLSPFVQPDVQHHTFDSFTEALDFWPLFFDYSLEVREGRNSNTSQLEEALKFLPRWKRRLTQLAMDALPDKAILVAGNEKHRLSAGRAFALMGEFNRAVLDLCTDILAHDGFNDIGVYGPMLNSVSDLTFGPCACGQSQLRTHRWVSWSGPRPEAYRHACPCSSAGLDSCGYEVAWKSSPRTVRLSELLNLSLTLAAPEDRYLIVSANAVLVRPTHDRRISGPVTELFLAPGAHSELTCSLQIPLDLPLGLHEVSVVAIINGALMQRCYMIDLLAVE